MQGERIKIDDFIGLESQQVTLEIPQNKGVYFIVIQTVNSKSTQKIVVK